MRKPTRQRKHVKKAVSSFSGPAESRTERSGSGISLVTVAGLGALAMVWLVAMTAMVVPMYRRAAMGGHQIVARSAAEAAIDYTIADLTDSLLTGESQLDDLYEDGTPKVTTLNPTVLGLSATGPQIEIEVDNRRPPQKSPVYDGDWDSTTNYWRVITATATYAGFQKKIRVVLKPEPTAGTGAGGQFLGGSGSGSSGTPVSYFRFGVLGVTSVSLSDGSTTDAYTSDFQSPYPNKLDNYGGDIASNNAIELSEATIGGDVQVYGDHTVSPTPVLASIPDSADPSAVTIKDQLVLRNGDQSGFTGTSGVDPVPGDNVQATGQESSGLGLEPYAPENPGRINANDGGLPPADQDPLIDWQTPIDSIDYPRQLEVPPAQNIPSDSVIVSPDIDFNGPSIEIPQPGPGEVMDLGSITLVGEQTANIYPGDYKISSLDITAHGAELNAITSGAGDAVRFFVDSAAAGSNVVQIGAWGINNFSEIPSNLQFWYDGTQSLFVNFSEDFSQFNGLIYAPKAPVTIQGGGQFVGAVVADTLTSSNTQFHFDKSLVTGDTSGGGGGSPSDQGLSYDSTAGVPGEVPPDNKDLEAKSYSVRTWQEVDEKMPLFER